MEGVNQHLGHGKDNLLSNRHRMLSLQESQQVTVGKLHNEIMRITLFVIAVGLDNVRMTYTRVDSDFALETVLHFRIH